MGQDGGLLQKWAILCAILKHRCIGTTPFFALNDTGFDFWGRNQHPQNKRSVFILGT